MNDVLLGYTKLQIINDVNNVNFLDYYSVSYNSAYSAGQTTNQEWEGICLRYGLWYSARQKTSAKVYQLII